MYIFQWRGFCSAFEISIELFSLFIRDNYWAISPLAHHYYALRAPVIGGCDVNARNVTKSRNRFYYLYINSRVEKPTLRHWAFDTYTYGWKMILYLAKQKINIRRRRLCSRTRTGVKHTARFRVLTTRRIRPEVATDLRIFFFFFVSIIYYIW